MFTDELVVREVGLLVYDLGDVLLALNADGLPHNQAERSERTRSLVCLRTLVSAVGNARKAKEAGFGPN